jgi:drug/metabolite transporter (DMT)-like permease
MHSSLSLVQTLNSRLGLIQIHSAVFLFGFAGLLGKCIDAGPATITFGRTFFAAIAILCGLKAAGRSLSIRTPKDLSTLSLSGFLLAVHWYTFFQSIQVSSVAVGLLTFSTFPIFVTFMEPYFFGERLETFDVVVALMTVSGVALVIPTVDLSNNITQGVFWGVLSGLTFAVLSMLNRMHVGKHPPLTVTFYQLGFATLFNLPFVIFAGVLPSTKDLFFLLVLGSVCTALAHALFMASLRHIKIQLASVTTGLEPVYGIAFAFLLMGEMPAVRTVVGGLIILGAAFLPVVKLAWLSGRPK